MFGSSVFLLTFVELYFSTKITLFLKRKTLNLSCLFASIIATGVIAFSCAFKSVDSMPVDLDRIQAINLSVKEAKESEIPEGVEPVTLNSKEELDAFVENLDKIKFIKLFHMRDDIPLINTLIVGR